MNVRGLDSVGGKREYGAELDIERRHPPNREKNIMRKMIAATTIAVGLVLAPSLDAVHAQDSTAAEDDDNGEIGLIGLAGLLGLAGLAGLKRRDRNDGARYDTSRDTGVSR